MKEIEQYRDLFINREDAYATQRRDGSYICRRKEVTDKVLVDHLGGRITCGWYCLNKGNQIKWACVDADSQDGQKLLQGVSHGLGLFFATVGGRQVASHPPPTTHPLKH